MHKNDNKLLIFGTKIQILNFVIFSENRFFRQNLRFSNSLHIAYPEQGSNPSGNSSAERL